jgi:hypothetical protein
MLLQAEAFSQGNFYTQKFFHRKVFFAQRSFYTQKLVHTEAFTHRSFYTGKRLDTEAITQRSRSTGQPSFQNLTFAAFLDVRPSVPAKMRLENRKILHQFLTLSQFLTCSLDFVPKGGAKGRGPPNSHFTTRLAPDIHDLKIATGLDTHDLRGSCFDGHGLAAPPQLLCNNLCAHDIVGAL